MRYFLLLCTLFAVEAHAQRFSIATTIGTEITLSNPASTPFHAQITGYWNLTPRFQIGAATGISCYEKALIPLLGSMRLKLTRERRFTPYLECGAGYAFATSCNANGGMTIAPSAGVQYALKGRLRLLLTIGYRTQRLERLKTHSDAYFTTAFHEKLRHSGISITTGILF